MGSGGTGEGVLHAGTSVTLTSPRLPSPVLQGKTLPKGACEVLWDPEALTVLLVACGVRLCALSPHIRAFLPLPAPQSHAQHPGGLCAPDYGRSSLLTGAKGQTRPAALTHKGPES